MTEQKELFEKYMNMGHAAAWEQSWDQASGYYRQALDIIPGHPMAMANLALSLFEMKVYDEALVYYQKICALTPQDPLPHEKIAIIYEQQGRLKEAIPVFAHAAELYLQGRDAEKAIANFTHVLSLQPENMNARTRLAAIYDRMGRKPEAVAEYIAIASLLQHAGDIAKAMRTGEYALSLMPENVDAQHSLAMLRTNQLLPKPARPRGGTGPVKMAEVRQLAAPEAAAVVQMDPISEAKQKALVRLAALLFDTAEEGDQPQTPTPRRGVSRIARGTGVLGRDQAERRRILLHIGQAIDSQSHGEDEQAAVELDRAVDIGLKHPAAFYNLGLIYSRSNKQKAMRHLSESIKHPDYATASYLILGNLYLDEGKLREAATAYLHALRTADIQTVPADQATELNQLYEPIIETQTSQADEKSLRKVCEVISTELMRNDWREFLRTARQQIPTQTVDGALMPLTEMLLQSHSSDVVRAMSKVRNLANQNKTLSALEEALFAIELAPTYLPLHMQIGELLLQEGRTQEAITKFLLVAELYSIRGEVSQAIKLLNHVLNLSPLDTTVRDKLIAMYISHGQVENALQQYMDLADIHYQLADLDATRETYTIALEAAQQARADRSWQLRILGKLADIDLQRLDWRQAARTLEQMRNLAPSDVNIRASLVDLRFKLGRDADAIKEIEALIAVLEGEGKRPQAIKFLDEVLAERPERLELRKRLADLYTLSGRVDKAVEQLDVILHTFIKGGNINAAKTVCQQIVTLKPKNVAEYQKMYAEMVRKS